jgi:hypothetical protein
VLCRYQKACLLGDVSPVYVHDPHRPLEGGAARALRAGESDQTLLADPAVDLAGVFRLPVYAGGVGRHLFGGEPAHAFDKVRVFLPDLPGSN